MIPRSKFKEFFKFSMFKKHFTTCWYIFISADCHVFVLHLGKTSPGSDPEVACLKKTWFVRRRGTITSDKVVKSKYAEVM